MAKGGNYLKTMVYGMESLSELLRLFWIKIFQNAINVHNPRCTVDIISGAAIVPNLTILTSKYLSYLLDRANVILIFKKNDNAMVDNYRPLSLLRCVAKLFERAVFNMFPTY